MDQNGGGIGFVTINLGFGTIFDFFHILQFERRTWPSKTYPFGQCNLQEAQWKVISLIS